MNLEGGRPERSSPLRSSVEAVLQRDTRFTHLEPGFRDQGQDNSIAVKRQKALDRRAQTGADAPDDKERRDLSLQVAWSDFWLPNTQETKNLLPKDLSRKLRETIQTDILADDKDPTNAEAHAFIARTLTKDARSELDETSRNQAYENARTAFEETLIYNPDNALANLFLNVPRADLEASQQALIEKTQKQGLTTEEYIRHSEITDAIQFQQALGLNEDTSLSKGKQRAIKAKFTAGGIVLGGVVTPSAALGGIVGYHLGKEEIERINDKRAQSHGRQRGESPQTGTVSPQTEPPQDPMKLLNQDGTRHDKRQETLTQRFNGEAPIDGQLRVAVKRAGDQWIIIGGDASQSFSAIFTPEAAQVLLTQLQTTPDTAKAALSAIGIALTLDQDTQVIGDATDRQTNALIQTSRTEGATTRATLEAETSAAQTTGGNPASPEPASGSPTVDTNGRGLWPPSKWRKLRTDGQPSNSGSTTEGPSSPAPSIEVSGDSVTHEFTPELARQADNITSTRYHYKDMSTQPMEQQADAVNDTITKVERAFRGEMKSESFPQGHIYTVISQKGDKIEIQGAGRIVYPDRIHGFTAMFSDVNAATEFLIALKEEHAASKALNYLKDREKISNGRKDDYVDRIPALSINNDNLHMAKGGILPTFGRGQVDKLISNVQNAQPPEYDSSLLFSPPPVRPLPSDGRETTVTATGGPVEPPPPLASPTAPPAEIPGPRTGEPRVPPPVAPELTPAEPEPSPAEVARLFSDPAALAEAKRDRPDSPATKQARALLNFVDDRAVVEADLPTDPDVIDTALSTLQHPDGTPKDGQELRAQYLEGLLEQLLEEQENEHTTP